MSFRIIHQNPFFKQLRKMIGYMSTTAAHTAKRVITLPEYVWFEEFLALICETLVSSIYVKYQKHYKFMSFSSGTMHLHFAPCDWTYRIPLICINIRYRFVVAKSEVIWFLIYFFISCWTQNLCFPIEYAIRVEFILHYCYQLKWKNNG